VGERCDFPMFVIDGPAIQRRERSAFHLRIAKSGQQTLKVAIDTA